MGHLKYFGMYIIFIVSSLGCLRHFLINEVFIKKCAVHEQASVEINTCKVVSRGAVGNCRRFKGFGSLSQNSWDLS